MPRTERHLVEHIEEATAAALELDWRLHDLVVMPVHELPRERRTPRTGREGLGDARPGADATRH